MQPRSWRASGVRDPLEQRADMGFVDPLGSAARRIETGNRCPQAFENRWSNDRARSRHGSAAG